MLSRPLALFSALLASAVALGQAPCPCPPAPEGPPPLWTGKAELSYVATSGNTDTSSLGAGFELNYKPAPWTFTLTGAYLRASSGGDLTAETLAGSLRGARGLTPRLDVFAAALYYRNRFAGVDSRYGGEAGAGYKIIDEKTLRLRAETAVGYTREDRIDFEAINYATARAGLDFGWKFSKSAELTELVSWTDNLKTTSDWFLSSTTALTANLTSVFALKASYTYLYDNVPVDDFAKRDTITSVALVAKF
ncbi:MAG: YdiY family protein [Acidobacteriota bacterium]